jgi:hypothetical protein
MALSEIFIKTALVYLMLGTSLGGVLLLDKGLSAASELWELRPLHIEWLFLGWTLQLALGGATWIMPRPHQLKQRTGLGWISYGLINGGLGAVTLGHFLSTFGDETMPSWWYVMAALAEVSGVVCFCIFIWPRAGFAMPKL